jgi:hypothetical protein
LNSKTDFIEVASTYTAAGLLVLPACANKKRPTLGKYKHLRHQLPTAEQLRGWFKDAAGICILTGAPSGNLEVLDFDQAGAAYAAWCDLVAEKSSDLLARLVVQKTQSGGRHVMYRLDDHVLGNRVLARCAATGKAHGETLIETRGEGGLVICYPSKGYECLQGSLLEVPLISPQEHATLIEAAQQFHSGQQRATAGATPGPAQSHQSLATGGILPGDEFNDRGDLHSLLRRHGWRQLQSGENEQWCRPGKQDGCSATLKNGVFYVFSSNAPPFEPGRGYSPFAVYAHLEHAGDFSAATKALLSDGFGASEDTDVDLSKLFSFRSAAPVAESHDEEDDDEPDPQKPAAPEDPGELPDRLLSVPGFINELMDHCLDTAPYPNLVMAFCGALALQAFLAGRRVRDPGDNRSNLYVLGLAHSAAGKDWPRKLNIKILQSIGLADCTGERFASGEGIQDSLFVTPSMLFQTDEIDGLLQSINKSRDARHEQIMSTLLTMYSSANSVYPMRRKAGKEAAGVINQPNLVIFGTAIPNHYYDALSERMLTNGLFARMLIFECGKRGKGQEPKIREIPESIIATASWWEQYRPGPSGNLGDWNPTPAIVPHDIDAGHLLVDARRNAEAQYEKAEDASDPVGTTVWGRVSEQTRKLALLHAVSRRCRDPVIDAESARWAIEVVEHQTRRMLFMASDHVSRNDFDAMAKEMVRQLRNWMVKHGDRPMPEWELTRRLPWRPSDHKEVVELLEKQRLVIRELRKSKTRSGLVYRLLEN